jgi:hypothetical protein
LRSLSEASDEHLSPQIGFRAAEKYFCGQRYTSRPLGCEASLRLLYRGEESLDIDGIRCIPCAEFLRALVPGKPLL